LGAIIVNSPTAIEIFELTRCFGELTALDHISLRVGSGQIFGLLGPNGSGKSTTIKILTTLLKPSAGTARVADFDILEQPAQVRARIGYVPQALSADGALTGRENLLLSARLYGVPKDQRNERIQAILQFMQLADAAEKLVKYYSGGMIRRLELAQAMLHRPAVLFLDEPTIGLDPVARFLVWEHLKDLRNAFKMTVLITTHDMEEADVLCDELAFLHQGKIVGQGKPAELKQSLGPAADLNDVFTHFSGSSFVEGGKFSDVRQTRYTAGRHG
jgi:ABC-2 type transport system ATP-binding protein